MESIEILYSQNLNSKIRLVIKDASCKRIKTWERALYGLLTRYPCSKMPIGVIMKTKDIKSLLGLQWRRLKYVIHLPYIKRGENGLGSSRILWLGTHLCSLWCRIATVSLDWRNWRVFLLKCIYFIKNLNSTTSENEKSATFQFNNLRFSSSLVLLGQICGTSPNSTSLGLQDTWTCQGKFQFQSQSSEASASCTWVENQEGSQ